MVDFIVRRMVYLKDRSCRAYCAVCFTEIWRTLIYRSQKISNLWAPPLPTTSSFDVDSRGECSQLLMRYVDDFMFVTTKKHLAVRFLQIMHRGKSPLLVLVLPLI